MPEKLTIRITTEGEGWSAVSETTSDSFGWADLVRLLSRHEFSLPVDLADQLRRDGYIRSGFEGD